MQYNDWEVVHPITSSHYSFQSTCSSLIVSTDGLRNNHLLQLIASINRKSYVDTQYVFMGAQWQRTYFITRSHRKWKKKLINSITAVCNKKAWNLRNLKFTHFSESVSAALENLSTLTFSKERKWVMPTGCKVTKDTHHPGIILKGVWIYWRTALLSAPENAKEQGLSWHQPLQHTRMKALTPPMPTHTVMGHTVERLKRGTRYPWHRNRCPSISDEDRSAYKTYKSWLLIIYKSFLWLFLSCYLLSLYLLYQ